MSRWKIIGSTMKAVLAWDDATFARRLRHVREAVDHALAPLTPPDPAPPAAREWVHSVAHAKTPDPVPGIFPSVECAAVILQGPICLADNFTLETVRYYRTTMPQAKLIVSTWNHEPADALRAIEAAGAAIVASPPPEQSGISNINRQIVSAAAGIQAAADEGCQYVLKVRTDTRLYNAHALQTLVGLLDAFPLRIAAPLEQRIVVLDYATRLYFPNHPSDMLMFGRLADMQRYWNIPLSHRSLPLGPVRTQADLWEVPIPEMHLCEAFLRGIGHREERSIANWWKTLAEFFIVVDREMLDHYWQKHGYAHDRPHIAQDWRRTLKLCRFADWIHLLHQPDTPVLDEAAIRACEIQAGAPGA